MQKKVNEKLILLQAGLTVREVAFKEWDADIVKEEEGVDGDNHDQVNLSAQELSKFVLCL